MMAAPEYLHLASLWSAILFWGGIIIFLMTVIVVGALSLHDRKKRRTVLGPVFLMSLGTVILGIGAAWYFWPAGEQTDELQGHAPSPLDNVVQIDCEPAQFPAVLPPNRLLDFQLAYPGVVAGGSFASYTLPPGSRIDSLSSTAFPSYTWVCRVSNFGAASIINVEAEFVVNFRKSGLVSDQVMYSGKITTPPINLSGNGGVCEIYARNFAPEHYAEVVLPKTATGQMIGSNERKTFRLATARFGGFILPPLERSKPQADSVPLPPARPH